MKKSDIGLVIMLVLAVLLTLGGIWLQLAGPCGVYKYSTVGHTPNRCVKELGK